MSFRYLSVCSGIEAASVAWKPLGWECVGLSEIEKFPRAVLQHRLGAVPVDDDHRWQPGQNFTPLFGDFTKIEAHHVGPVDLLVGGTPCFPEGTMIASTRGLIPIEAVRVGDEVLTHEHRFRRVLRTGSKMAETVEVTGQGHYGFVTTANHPFLARQKMGQSTRVDGRAVRKTWITDADWVAAEHMEGKHWACVSRWPEMPVPQITVIGNETVPSLPVRDLMMIAGAYLGDGWIRSNERRGAVMFGINPSKLDALRPAFDAYGKWHSTTERTVVKVGICSRPLARWLAENFGAGAANKRVPMWALGHPERDALLQGYLLTDGGKVQFGHRATTISPDLALTMRMLAVSCGYSSSVGFSERPATHQIEGRTVNQSDTYTVTFGTSARSSFEDGGFRWQRVRSVQPTGRVERVYDLEVEEDHSYVADGICVHNCQSFSIAGKRLGLDDPRGNLTLEFLALAKRVRPTWLLYENVPGLLSHDEGRTFGTFLGLLAECGFDRAAWRILDAQYVRTRRFGRAVPQRRRRVFLVGYSGTADIHPRAVLFDRESLRGNPAPRREAGQSTPANAGKSPDRCSVDGCDRPKAKRGWCNSHYQRWRASGNPGSGPVNAPNRPDHERFWEKVDRTGDCWVYTGSLSEKGYGIFWSNAENRTMRAHRFAFEDQVGPIPDGLQLDHLCRNPACCRPSHLEVVTPAENTRRGNAGKHWAEKRGEIADVVPTIAARTRGGGGLGTDFDCDGGLVTAARMVAFGEYVDDGTASVMKARDYKDATDLVAHSLRAEGFDASEDGTGRGTPIVPVQHEVMSFKPGQSEAAGGTFVTHGYAPTLQAANNGSTAVPAVAVPVQHPIAIQERAVSENPDAGPDGKGWRDDGAAYTLEARQVTQAVAFAQNTRDEVRLFGGDGQTVGALSAEPGMKQTSYVAFTAKDHGGDAVENISPTLRAGGHTGSHANAGVMPAIAFAHQAAGKQTTLGAVDDGTCQTLGAHQTPAVAFDMRGREGGAMPEGPHDTANIRAASGGSSRSYAASQAWGVRRLTPTECERLQGFPDGWTQIPWGKKPAEECPDGPRYKALGNSMAVNVMCWIGERIEAVRAVEVADQNPINS